MLLEVDSSTAVVFDLDDTLYKERDFQVSGFREVLASIGRGNDDELLEELIRWDRAGENSFALLVDTLALSTSVGELLTIYRRHVPKIALEPGARQLLGDLRAHCGGLALLTDGRSRTQRSKLEALGIEASFDVIIISEEIGSEKPDPANYLAVQAQLPGCGRFVFIGDNPNKDFVTANSLGWTTVQIDDDGRNVHSAQAGLPVEFEALFHAESIGAIQVSWVKP